MADIRPDNRQFAQWEKGPSSAAIFRVEAEKKALEYRKKGLSYDEIADIMKISRNAACTAVRNALKAIKNDCRELAEDVLDLEVARLDEMLVAVLKKARAGDLEAVDRVLKIQDRRAKYLGLDQAVKTQVSFDQSTIPLQGMTEEDLDLYEALVIKALAEAGRMVESVEDMNYLALAQLEETPLPTRSRTALFSQIEHPELSDEN